jgi:predicted GNAT family acetyltransferase
MGKDTNAARHPPLELLRISCGTRGIANAQTRRIADGMSETIEVLHNSAAHRYEMTVEGHLSVCEYELKDGTMIFTHTVVPPELRGRGIAEKLVRAALTEARAQGRKVVPACSYVAKFVERHAEYRDLLAS